MVKDKVGEGDQVRKVDYFHLSCCRRFQTRADEVFEAVNECPFPSAEKDKLRQMLVELFYNNERVLAIDVEGILRAAIV
jgi:hypothetical protein